MVADEAARHQLSIGFFTPEDRAAGILTPDSVSIWAVDVSAEAAFDSRLHPRFLTGKFKLDDQLREALSLLRQAHDANDQALVDEWMGVCERGALCHLRRAGMVAGLGCPLFDWPHSTPRTCTRFGEAYASFPHTDLRVTRSAHLSAPVPRMSHASPVP